MKMELGYMISAGSYPQESNKTHQNYVSFDVVLARKWSFHNLKLAQRSSFGAKSQKLTEISGFQNLWNWYFAILKGS